MQSLHPSCLDCIHMHPSPLSLSALLTLSSHAIESAPHRTHRLTRTSRTGKRMLLSRLQSRGASAQSECNGNGTHTHSIRSHTCPLPTLTATFVAICPRLLMSCSFIMALSLSLFALRTACSHVSLSCVHAYMRQTTYMYASS